MSSTPPLPPIDRSAFFFDFDGTLVDLAATPEGVTVSPSVVPLLTRLQALSGGALAVVSGRPLAALDAFLHPLVFAAAGSHGAERREPNGAVSRIGHGDARLAAMHTQLEGTVAAHEGLLLERKDVALAVHYRLAPTLGDVVRAAAEAAVAPYADTFTLQPGKMVVEIKPSGVDKGRAIDAFMAQAPFAGRTAVFLGDDLTDEKGFAVVNRLGGMSVKVGEGETLAPYRLATVTACIEWIESLVASAG
ncbi:trehalose-phosphatase [Chitinasiproducens palmae]|uniref:Trehalose 6-phosphate phosphatase n=1 Tax=Chitinasiproducens palmae TaxID=1770053 RepID=A0A1H2PUV0_9BURK|nr:trehalose-phosphatase [Chitinasiproducens palmae]SDV51009.1 trehalose 6-phosphatase [Chitinasiproducens palmae]